MSEMNELGLIDVRGAVSALFEGLEYAETPAVCHTGELVRPLPLAEFEDMRPIDSPHFEFLEHAELIGCRQTGVQVSPMPLEGLEDVRLLVWAGYRGVQRAGLPACFMEDLPPRVGLASVDLRRSAGVEIREFPPEL